jgi:hypothetical protein
VVCREEKRAAKEKERAEGAGKRHREEVDNDRWRPADDSDDERHGRRQGTFSLGLAMWGGVGVCGVSRGVGRKFGGENAH